MANFIIVIDPDVERRNRFIEKIKPELSPVKGLFIESCSAGNFCAAWSAAVQSPISYVVDEQGAAMIWGDAISRDGSERIDAGRLRSLWSSDVERAKAVFDGFYAAAVYQPNLGLVVGADVLGVFPIYYWTGGEVLLVGSSPELFRYHPAFKFEFNPVGLVGILLTMHIFDGQTLQQGVRRLDAGHQLLWQRGKSATEVLQYRLPVSENYFSLPFSAHVEILGQAVDKTITRHVRGDSDYTLLLSGGLDSRMAAGYLSEKGINIRALTLGLPTDLEMKNAIPVARKLGFKHSSFDVGFEQYSRCASLQAEWEHLSNGFNNIINWGINSHLVGSAQRVIIGHMIDAVIGTRYITWAYSASEHTMSFDSFFSNVNRWGINPNILKKLLRKELFGDLVDETIARIRNVYESYSELESQRSWCFNLYNRQRFHVGSAAWALSFGAWAVVPALDRRLLEIAGAMPAATIAERRAEEELLCRRFPQLASLRLDRNSYNTEPLRPRLRYQLGKYFYSHLGLRRLRHIGGNGESERRYYFRTYDFNSPGWLAVRQQAEPYRDRLFEFFNRDVLEELLPAPEATVSVGDGIIETSGLKLLLGLMLWSKDHL